MTTKDDENELLRSVALKNATSILVARQRAEQRSEFYLAEGQRLSHTGSLGWTPSTGELLWSEETFRIFQYDPATQPTMERVLERVHPEDAALVRETIERAAQKGRDFDFEYRLLMPDRSVRHVHIVARASRDESGGPEFAGAVMDVTEHHEARAALEKALDEIKRSEKQLQLVVDTIPTMVWSTLPDGSLDLINRPWVEYLGHTREDLRRHGWERVLHPDDAAETAKTWSAALAAGTPYEHETRIRQADGAYRWFLVRAAPLRDERGEIVRWFGSTTDIEDRKRAEMLLSGEKRLLERIARGESRALILDDLCRLVEELAGGSVSSILLLDAKTRQLRHGAAPSLPASYSKAIDGIVIGPSVGSCGTAAHRAEPVIVADIATDPLWADFRDLALSHGLRACWSSPIVSSAGEVLGTFATYYRQPRSPTPEERNVIERFTQVASIALEREQAEEGLRRQANMLEQTHDAILVWWLPGTILYWNRGAERLYGFSRSEAIGRTSHDLLRTEHPMPAERFETLIERDGTWTGELTHRARDGRRVVVDSRHVLVREGDGRKLVLETNRDITDRKRAEYLTEHVFESSPDAVTIVGTDYRLQRVNPVSVRRWALPVERMVGRHIRDVMGMDIFGTAKPYLDRCFDGEDVGFAGWLTMPLGRRHVVVTCSPLRPQSERVEAALVISRDITEQALAAEALGEAQAQLAHVTRVTTLGEVTASLAHEVNQPLAAIVNNANACLGLLPNGRDLDEVREALADIVNDGDRASAIIERVRGLAKRSSPQKAALRLADVVADVVALAAAESATRRVAIRTDVAPDVPVVLADRVQLQQVLLNLVVNGMDAMSAVAEGERLLEIRGRPDRQDGAPAALLSVEDRGIGLEAGQADSVFEAFYTTKPHGMGMGLAISRSIIEAHGGRLWAESNHGPGATFAFSLPAAATGAAP